jgi:sugar O-acyltransferase (sialic acid O-acetyltransferase NeuD family)
MSVILVGCGGHARVLMDCLRKNRVAIIGYVAPKGERASGNMAALECIGDDEALARFDTAAISLVNAVGSIRSTAARREVFDRLRTNGFKFSPVLHPSAVIADDVQLGEGAQIMAGALLQPGVVIGENTIINTRASIDHDCIVGAHSHVACGAVLSGGVRLGEGSHVGTGAAIAQSVKVGMGCLIGMGAAVSSDVSDGDFVAGVPARRIGLVDSSRT